jgi:hypothetical protein
MLWNEWRKCWGNCSRKANGACHTQKMQGGISSEPIVATLDKEKKKRRRWELVGVLDGREFLAR